MSAIAAAEQLFKRKKEREKKELLKKRKKKREETGFEPWVVKLQPGALPITLRRS